MKNKKKERKNIMKNTLQTFKQNFVNGALIDGTMLVDVDCNCDNVIIPDDTEFVYRISRELDLSKVKKMTVHSVEFLNALTLGFVKQFPKHIVIDCAAMIPNFRRQYGASLITTAILTESCMHREERYYASVQNQEEVKLKYLKAQCISSKWRFQGARLNLLNFPIH